MILSAVPGAVVNGQAGRRTSFEVTVNEMLVFSKLKLGSFPEFEAIVKMVQGVAHGEKPHEVTECAKSSCVVL
jgi:selT/selW/selH-like putative selenoprotein